MTARDLIKASLRQLGVLAEGENPTNAQAQDALTSLNDLLDSWSTERLAVYEIAPTAFPLVAGQKTYTLGPGGNINTAQYVSRVETVQLTYNTGAPNPANLPVKIVGLDEYQRFTVPDTQNVFPLYVYIDGQFPLRNVSFFPVPSAVNTVEVFAWQPLSEFATLDTVVSLPPGYSRALKYSLAIEIADEYGTEPSQTLVAKAVSAKAAIKSVNLHPPLMRVDAGLQGNGGQFNWLVGE